MFTHKSIHRPKVLKDKDSMDCFVKHFKEQLPLYGEQVRSSYNRELLSGQQHGLSFDC